MRRSSGRRKGFEERAATRRRESKGVAVEVGGRRRGHGGVLGSVDGSEDEKGGVSLMGSPRAAATDEPTLPKNGALPPTNMGTMSNWGVMAAGAVPLLGFAGLAVAGVVYRDELTSFLFWFTEYVQGMGPSGPALFMAIYVALEVLAVPAIPLTMSAGAIFGPVQGTAMVSVSATTAAAISFLIARYALRDKIRDVAAKNPKFAAIDRAIGEDSFRVVALLRLSPLLPFALSNYLYGLTSVKFRPYVLASCVGMLPGTFAYVSAGSVGMTLMEAGGEAAVGGAHDWTHIAQIASGFGFALISGAYVARLASEALKDVEEDMNSIEVMTSVDSSAGEGSP